MNFLPKFIKFGNQNGTNVLFYRNTLILLGSAPKRKSKAHYVCFVSNRAIVARTGKDGI
jgi:hypothetical protein